MFNVAKNTGETMLLEWVNTRSEAEKYLSHYLTKYKPGSPYPNGKGTYPDWGFHIVKEGNDNV